MNILLITANYVPEIGSSAQIYLDLAEGFINHGHTVHVLTSYPRDYTLTTENQDTNIPIDSNENGVMVHRVRHPSKRDSLILRGLEHFYIPVYYFKKYKEIRRTVDMQFDVCIFHIPPLPFYYLARWIKWYDGTQSIFNMQDYHPQELTDVGFLKNPIMIAILKYIERRLYKNADCLIATSPGGVKYITERGANPTNVGMIFNPLNSQLTNDTAIPRNYKELEHIEGKTLITYAGILSPFQRLDTVLDVAKLLSKREDIIFYIVGDGMERARLESRIISEKITNVKIHAFLPRAQYFNLIQSTDIALISLDERMKAPCFPGKTLNLMAMGKAILVFAAVDCEVASIVSAAKAGVVTPPSNLQHISSTILKMVDDQDFRQKLGKAGNIYFMQNMSIDTVVAHYETVIKQMKKPISTDNSGECI